MEEFSSIGYIKAWLEAMDGCDLVDQKAHTHESKNERGGEKREGLQVSRVAAQWE